LRSVGEWGSLVGRLLVDEAFVLETALMVFKLWEKLHDDDDDDKLRR